MPEPKKSNHQANIVRLGEPRVHTNADTLELYDISGYQVVTKKGQFKDGDLAVYIQPDSVVPQTEPFKFIWGEYLPVCASCDSCPTPHGHSESLVPERRRRITVRKFRKEWSEGLLLPVSDFSGGLQHEPNMAYGWLKEGEDVSDLLGITHWDGDSVESTEGLSDSRPKRKYPRSLKGWFFFVLHKLGFKGAGKQLNEELSFDVPKFDVESIKNYKSALRPGEDVIVTEKIHGSQGRFFFREGKMYAGSRNFWKAPNSPCIWRKVLRDQPWIEEYCRANEGNVLYGEVVPTQKGYRYGVEEGKSDFFVFDVRGGDGSYLPKDRTLTDPALRPVPVLYAGPYDEAKIAAVADGPSVIPGAKTAREGVVVTATDPARGKRGIGRVQLKLVSNSFLEKDSK